MFFSKSKSVRRNKSSKKKPTKFKSSRFNRTQKTLALSFVLVFGVVGSVLIFRSYAASTPPSSMTESKSAHFALASDGVRGSVYCTSVYSETNYGHLAYCLQIKPERGGDEARVGIYEIKTKIFQASTGWIHYVGAYHQQPCKNMNYHFEGDGWVSTAYGQKYFGQIYRFVILGSGGYGKWQIRFAQMNHSDGKCYPSGPWMYAKPW